LYKLKIFKSKLGKDIFLQIVINGASKALSFYNQYLIVGLLGVYNIGYSSMIQIYNYQASAIFDLGLNNIGIREKNGINEKKYYQLIISLRLIVSLSIFIAWIIITYYFINENKFLWYIASIGVLLPALDLNFYFRIKDKINLFAFIRGLSAFVVFVVYINLKPSQIIIGTDYIVTTLSILFVTILTWIIYLHYDSVKFFNLSEYKLLFLKSKYIIASSTLLLLYPTLQYTLLNNLLGYKSVGILRNTLLLVLPIEFIVNNYGNLLIGYFRKWQVEGRDHENILKLFKISLIFILPITFVIFLCPENLINFFLHKRFEFSFISFKLLIFAKLGLMIFSPFTYYEIVNKNDKLYLKLSIILFILSLILNIILLPRYGIIGASISILICDLSQPLFYFYKFIKR
jgi:O-antigen/teichoic acid export membrane protein